MKQCQQCKAEIPDDSLYCPECGTKQEESPFQEETEDRFCAKCGARLEADALFCPECGQKTGEEPEEAGACVEEQIAQKPKGKGHIVIIIFLLIAALLVGGLAFAFKVLVYDRFIRGPQLVQSELENYLNGSGGSDFLESDDYGSDMPDADNNLIYNSYLSHDGEVKPEKNGDVAIQWDSKESFYGSDYDSGESVLLKTKKVYLDGTCLPENMLEGLKKGTKVSVEGTFYIREEKLYVAPDTILDKNGRDLISEYTESQQEDILDADYILPDSNSVILTGADVENLSLQELNYARNEIFARHGRRFKSQELQSYFDSRDWYSGTIDPDSFSESMLSDVEKQNAEFLRNQELARDSAGYQLDTY